MGISPDGERCSVAIDDVVVSSVVDRTLDGAKEITVVVVAS